MEKPNRYQKYLILGLATLGGAGYFPVAPGTFASVLAIGASLFIKNDVLFLMLGATSVILALFACGRAEKIINRKDPKIIVIDDFSGQLIALLFIPRQTAFILLAFFLFRIFDILKVYPASRLDKRSGSVGIVGDDLAAGIYANLFIQTARLFI